MTKNIEKEISASLEDYIMVIYETIEEKQGVKAVDISRRLGVGRSSVTDALKSLAQKGLINYNPYDVISLTSKGEKIAIDVVEKHKILHDFFENVLTLSKEEAAKNACGMSHAISQEAFDKFVQFISKAEK
jgi:DtxR family transcriptional regulator, Mn-dependent transcriptional regulator